MKKILSFSLLIFAATALFGQQDPQFTQFMYNKLGYNPGYAGSGDGTSVTALIRRQWMGLEGAPGAQLRRRADRALPGATLSGGRLGEGAHRAARSARTRAADARTALRAERVRGL